MYSTLQSTQQTGSRGGVAFVFWSPLRPTLVAKLVSASAGDMIATRYPFYYGLALFALTVVKSGFKIDERVFIARLRVIFHKADRTKAIPTLWALEFFFR